MATFPTDPAPIYPLVIEPEWKTLISNLDGGGEDRRQKWLYPKYNVRLKYSPLTKAEMQTLWNFYLARRGAYEAFYIYDLVSMDHDGQYCATADGSTDIFDLPGKATSSQTIYLDGIEQTVTTDYSILTGGGESDSDRVDFVSAPAAGAIVTADFTGFLRMRVRFAQDKLSREMFSYLLFNHGLELKGLSAA